MTFDWYEYLVLAEYLYDNRDTFPDRREACLRVVISRAYYAAFCSARNCARDFDSLPLKENGQDHGLVRNHYNNSRDSKIKRVGNLLSRLRNLRNEADYIDMIDEVEMLAETALYQSKQIHILLKQIYHY
jgi:uncharacterized protein (UPF0332 family)